MRRLQDLLGSDLKHTRLLADVTSLQLSQRVLVFTCGNTRADAVAMVISRTVYEQLREEYAAEWVATLQEVGDLLLQTGRLRTTARYFIEDLLHAALTSHGQCFPAYDLSSRVPTSASSGAVFHVSTQSDKFLSFGDKSIQICSAKTVPNTALALAIFVKHDRTAALPRYVYLRPKAANNATFDACVLLDDGVIWLLQYSVSREHNISAVGLDWIKKHYSKQHRANWTVNYVYFSTAMPAEVELPVSNEVSNAITAAFFVQVHHKPLVKAYSPHYLQKLREFAEDE
ncbi:hypothetical protein EXIGLDRAFT_736852 [Exidia glandulosa HHB12029]|uniref:Uncharacterized protein n=1 Tax=Exidia glandulosa HHB12029 TaxID=1314781 RepID=A0A165PGG6_EXIGL|nr:hypothetical protein EXIGLDRAFT_736852 [Exidia glandulosa HHB12029]